MIDMLTKDYMKDLLADGFVGHFNPIMNSTIPYYQMLMYTFIYALGLQNILEVGILRGYTSYYLARAANVNGGHFYGIDIAQKYCDEVKAGLDSCGLKNTIICADTKKIDRIEFTNRIDVAFLDGEHNTKAVLHEIELIYPLMPGNGTSYFFIHDIIDQGNSDAWWRLKQDPRFEGIGMNANYGLGILRKLEGMDYKGLAEKFGQIKSKEEIVT